MNWLFIPILNTRYKHTSIRISSNAQESALNKVLQKQITFRKRTRQLQRYNKRHFLISLAFHSASSTMLLFHYAD